jgi:hypoxanthine phosphoribosyltransferase
MGLKPYFSPERLEEIVGRVALQMASKLGGTNPVLVGVLKGSYTFLADLSRKLGIDHEIDFIQTACYGLRDMPANEVLILRDITAELKGREVVIVEDIIDRGHTARVLLEHFRTRGASSIRLCALLKRKGGAPGVPVDFVGEEIGDGFVVGYGMDYKERYRNLPGLYLLEDG